MSQTSFVEIGFGKMNVLIVESKLHLAELWRRALEPLGAHVDIASSQDQAADIAAIIEH